MGRATVSHAVRAPAGLSPPEHTGELLVSGALTAAFIAIAFIAGDGSADLAGNTWVQIGLLVLGAGALVSWRLRPATGPRWGLPALVWFAALAALTFASIAWSVDPATSWLEANRTLSYLAAFAAMLVFARLAPGRWRALVLAMAAATTVVTGYALVVKVFPDVLDRGDPLGRLNAPLGYWNAIGGMAAMGLPPALWLGASPAAPRALRITSGPALALLIAAVLMSVSRGALIAAVIGVGLWFAVVPLRLRAAALLAVGVAGAAGLAGWALSSHGLSDDQVPQHVRVVAGHRFGLVLLAVVALTFAASWGLVAVMDRVAIEARARRRIGTALLVALALIPVGGVVALAASSRGVTGEISHVWHTLTNPSGGAGNAPTRLLTLSNSRTRYWGDGLTVGEHHPLLGSGALGFAVAHRRYSTVSFPVAHAHDYWIETFADLGLLGVAISLGLLVTWMRSAGRALGLDRAGGRRARVRLRVTPDSGAQWTGLVTLAAVVVIFALHSLVDWTWFIPGVAVPAIACAGWLSGRGPLDGLVGGPQGEPRRGAVGQPGGGPSRVRRLTESPASAMAILGIAAATLGVCWTIAQPLRSADADAAAIGALSRGDPAMALADARQAVADDPLALGPRYDLSAIYLARGRPSQARSELLHAVSLQPENPSSWQTLGSFDLEQHRPRRALSELQRALHLDPHSAEILALVAQARAAA